MTEKVEMTEELELIDYLRVIQRRKWLIVLGTFACILAAGIISWLLPPSYQSEVILKIGRVSVVDENGKLQEIVVDNPYNVKARLTSESFILSIIEKNQLELEPKDLKARAEVVSKEVRGGETNLVRFSIRARSPEEAVSLINSIAEGIIARHRKKFDEAMKINFLRQEELKEQIASIEEGIRELRESISHIQKSPRVDAPAVILLQANLAGKERSLSELKGMYRKVQLANSPISSENTKVCDPAIKPKHPVSPKKLLNIIIATVVGLMAAVMLAFFLEYLQKVKGEEKQ